MRKRSADAWIRKQKIEKEEFIADWDWDRVVLKWKNRLADFSITTTNLFTKIHVFDSENPIGREPEFSWWPVDQIRRLQLQLQEYLDVLPGTKCNVHPNQYLRDGELDTVKYIWSVSESEAAVCALVISASLFLRMHSSRNLYPSKNWPPYHCVEALDEMARAKLSSNDEWEFLALFLHTSSPSKKQRLVL